MPEWVTKLDNDSEQPVHSVQMPAFQISRYPVTTAQYQAFVADGGYTKKWRMCWSDEGWQAKEENYWDGPRRFRDSFGFPNHPVVGVSWYEAEAFCKWLTEQLRHPPRPLPGEAGENSPPFQRWGTEIYRDSGVP